MSNNPFYVDSKFVDETIKKAELELGVRNSDNDNQKIDEMKDSILQLIELSLDPFENQQGINALGLDLNSKMKYFQGRKLSKRDIDTFKDNADQLRLHVMELFDSGMNVNFIVNQKKMVEKLTTKENVRPGEEISNIGSTILDDIPRAKRFNIDIYESDLKRLSNNEWFNDKLVNFWINLLTEVKALKLNGKFDQKAALIPSWCFSTLVKGRSIDKITEDELDFKNASYFLQEKSRESGIKSGNLLGMVERVFFIINISNSHWVMVESKRHLNRNVNSSLNANIITSMGRADYSRHEFELILYDPMSDAYSKFPILEHPILKLLREFIKYEVRFYENRNVRDHEFQFSKSRVAQQKNLYDCGPYICKYAQIAYLEDEANGSDYLKNIQSNEIKTIRKQFERIILDIGFGRELPGYIQKFII